MSVPLHVDASTFAKENSWIQIAAPLMANARAVAAPTRLADLVASGSSSSHSSNSSSLFGSVLSTSATMSSSQSSSHRAPRRRQRRRRRTVAPVATTPTAPSNSFTPPKQVMQFGEFSQALNTKKNKHLRRAGKEMKKIRMALMDSMAEVQGIAQAQAQMQGQMQGQIHTQMQGQFQTTARVAQVAPQVLVAPRMQQAEVVPQQVYQVYTGAVAQPEEQVVEMAPVQLAALAPQQQEAVIVSPLQLQVETPVQHVEIPALMPQPVTQRQEQMYHVSVQQAPGVMAVQPSAPVSVSTPVSVPQPSAPVSQTRAPQQAVQFATTAFVNEFPQIVDAAIESVQAQEVQMTTTPLVMVGPQPEIVQQSQYAMVPFYYALNLRDTQGGVRRVHLGSTTNNITELQQWVSRNVKCIDKLLRRVEKTCYLAYQGGAADAGARGLFSASGSSSTSGYSGSSTSMTTSADSSSA